MMFDQDKENVAFSALKDLNETSMLSNSALMNSSNIYLHNKERFIQMKQKAMRKS